MPTQAFKLRNSHRPALPSGTYTLKVNQTGRLSTDRRARSLADTSFAFDLSQPMSALAPADIVTLYPADGASAPFDHVIPHIVLKNSMLPWMEEMPAPAGKSMAPCLALVLLRPGEAFSFDDDTSAPDHARIRNLKLKPSLAETVIPALSDLPKLTHVRVVDDSEHAVVLSNRLPTNGGINTLCLVRLTDACDAPTRTVVSLPCLKTWRFRCTVGKNHFHAVFDADNFSVGRLRAPLPDQSSAAWYGVAQDKLSSGYVPMAHHTAHGDDAISWYRGPFLPGPELPDHSVQKHQRHHLELKDLKQIVRSPATFVQLRSEFAHRRHPTLEDETGDLCLTFFRNTEVGGPTAHHGTDRFRLRVTRQTLQGYMRQYPDIEKVLGIENQLHHTSLNVLHAWLSPRSATAFFRVLLEIGRAAPGHHPQFFLSPEMHLRPNALVVRDEVTQLQDVSYAVAWQIGRLTALADGNYRRAVTDWRRSCANADAKSDAAGDHAHLCCKMPEHDEQLPPEVDVFLVRLSQLEGIPLSYLVPSETMLPASSLRTFLVDPLWTYRLLQGALSIGSEACPCETTESRALKRLAALARVNDGSPALSGLIMRSEAVSTWPGLKVSFHGEDGGALRKITAEPRKPAPDVLLTLASEPFKAAGIALPEAHPHFEFARRHAGTSPGAPMDPGRILSAQQDLPEEPVIFFSKRAVNYRDSGQPFTSLYVPKASESGANWTEGPPFGIPPANPPQPEEHEQQDQPALEALSLPEDGLWLRQITLETGVEIAQHFQIGAHSVRIDFGNAYVGAV